VDSFASFSSSTVSEEQIQAAKDCIHNGGPSSTRYVQIPFDDIMSQNQVGGFSCACFSTLFDSRGGWLRIINHMTLPYGLCQEC